jgi:hydroxymethylbilane synthase
VKRIRIGTRGSALALWQAKFVLEELTRRYPIEAELVPIRTSGDRFQTASIEQVQVEGGTKGIFIKEIEDALLVGSIDLAVHSMKDVPTEMATGLAFAAITKREDPRDCLISRDNCPLKDLPRGIRVGTGSLRRQAQLRRLRPDLEVVEIRGNVDTRMKKVATGEFEAVVLAVAGVTRLGAREKIAEIFEPEAMLPAVGQGALGIETRAGDHEIARLVADALDHAETRVCASAERALLRELDGGCQMPLGALARETKGEIHLEACVFSADGRDFVRRDLKGQAGQPEQIGKRLGQILREAGADKILQRTGWSVGRS